MNAGDPHKALIAHKKGKSIAIYLFLLVFFGALGENTTHRRVEMRAKKREYQAASKSILFKFIGLHWHETKNSFNKGKRTENFFNSISTYPRVCYRENDLEGARK